MKNSHHMITCFLSILIYVGCQQPNRQQNYFATQQLPQSLETPPEAADLDPDEGVVHIQLTAAELENGNQEPFQYAYNGLNPGPIIRAKVGDEIIVELSNNLSMATTIHWHGVKVPWEMDGITWMMDPIMPDESFEYRFQVNQAGTFWYHPHFNTENQVDGGLYGVLVLEDPNDPVPDAELVLLFDSGNEFQEHSEPIDPDDEPTEDDGHVLGHDHGHGQLITEWLVNGQSQPTYTVQGGDVVRVRAVNVSNFGYLSLTWPDMRQIASDQGLLPHMVEPESVLLTPGDRAEFEWLIGETGFTVTANPYSLNGGPTGRNEVPLFDVLVNNPAPPPDGLNWPFPGGESSPDPSYTDIYYTFSGSDRTQQWLINGEKFPDITIETLSLGEEAIIEVRNLSPTEHPFHLHGHHFEVLSINSIPPQYLTIEDTINLSIRDRLRLRLTADNPGDWMTHCHILPHVGDGMMTVLRVTE
jgi:FtsP/CotA-like multicopper oxidase with cupredoxin domain